MVRKILAGQMPDSRDHNSLADRLIQTASPQSVGGIEFIANPGGFVTHDHNLRPHWARITGRDGYKYSHVSYDTFDPDAMDDFNELSPFHIIGTTSILPAIEVNQSEDVEDGTIVYLVPSLDGTHFEFNNVASGGSPCVTGFLLLGQSVEFTCTGGNLVPTINYAAFMTGCVSSFKIAVSGTLTGGTINGITITGNTREDPNAGAAIMDTIATSASDGTWSGFTYPYIDLSPAYPVLTVEISADGGTPSSRKYTVTSAAPIINIDFTVP